MVGPSSSHTAGMVRIGAEAKKIIDSEIKQIDITLSPKLESTYSGHGTDAGLIGGLLGMAEDCPDIKRAVEIAKERGIKVNMSFFAKGEQGENTARLNVTKTNGELVSVIGVSVGGGSILIKEINGKPCHIVPATGYLPSLSSEWNVDSYEKLFKLREGKTLGELGIIYEMKRTGADEETIRNCMRKHFAAMKESVKKGEGTHKLNYGFATGKDAFLLSEGIKNNKTVSGGIVPKATAKALGVMELNASMGCVVAAPTAGSAGVVSGSMIALQEEYGFSDEKMVDALFAAAATGVVMSNRKVSFSGSVGGCQGEIGASAAICAAGIVSLFNDDPRVAIEASALTIKNMLGLVCDPILGAVEVPCIKRNSAGVANAFIAADMALSGIKSFIPPDEVLDALIDVENRLPDELRSGTCGGLSCTATVNRIKKERGLL